VAGSPPFYEFGAGRRLAYHDAENHRLVLALGQDSPICDGAPLAIDSEDEMFRLLYYTHGEDRGAALAMYFRSGLAIWESCRELLRWRFGDLTAPGMLLDFACGHGRVTRFAAHELGAARVEAAEIEPGALTFARREFGVMAHQSSADPAGFDPGKKYAAILVSSLFTHLPRPAFAGWLRRLGGLLAADGVLLASTHDLSLMPAQTSQPANGFLFAPQSESRSLPGEEYGTTWLSEAAARELIREALPEGTVFRLPNACGGLQDFYAVAVGAGSRALPAPALPPPVVAHLDTASLSTNRRLTMRGGCADRRGGAPPRGVELRSAGHKLTADVQCAGRPEADALFASEGIQTLGFDLEVELPAGTRTALPVSLIVLCGDGTEAVAYEGTVASLLLQAVRLDLHSTTHLLEETRLARERAEATAATLGREVEMLRGMVQARQRSPWERLRGRLRRLSR
jgi:SAM-dependent methyltransferase